MVDDRKDFANNERFPEAEKIVNSDFDNAFDELPIRKNTFIIIATRGHNFDDIVLEKAVKTDAKYVALLGSKRKAILIYESLLKKGISEERLREVRSPAGLDIGARTPNEIAVSIVAEMISFRNNSSSMPAAKSSGQPGGMPLNSTRVVPSNKSKLIDSNESRS